MSRTPVYSVRLAQPYEVPPNRNRSAATFRQRSSPSKPVSRGYKEVLQCLLPVARSVAHEQSTAAAGSNWTLAEGGFPQRIPSYRPKKRRAPPPPPQAPAPPAVAVSSPPQETSDTTVAEQQPEVGVGAGAAEVTETTTVVVTVSAATPPPTGPGEPALVEVSVTEGVAGGGGPAEAAPGVEEAPRPEAAAPLAEGEDDADLAPADNSSQAEARDQPRGSSAELPSCDAAVSAEGSEQPAPLDAVPTPTEAVEKEEHATEVLEQTAGNSDTVEAASTSQGEAAVSPESSASKPASEEAVVEITPQILTLTIREYKEPTAPSAEVTEVSQESKDSVEAETKENVPVTDPEVANPTVEVELKVETRAAAEPAGPTVGDVPPTETKAEEPLEEADEAPDEPRKSALASFREDYLTKHYKGDLPVLQITESDLADEDERKEGSPVTKLSTGLPVLHISEEDLMDEPAAETEKPTEAAAAEATANGPSPALRERGGESPCRRSSVDARRESPQPPPRQSSAQELNSKIYFRVLPPLAASGGSGGAPQLKTFSPPSSPPGRGPKPQPPLRNGVAAGEASPPRTKSPLPTPRRRHQPLQRDA